MGTDDPVQWGVAKDRLSQAIAMDPDFASALALLAVLRLRLFTINWPGSPGFLPLAEREARTAVGLRPELAFVHMASGCVHAAQGNWVTAEECFAVAAGLDEEWPILGAVHIAHVLLSVGHVRRALAVTRASQGQPHGMIGILLIYAVTCLFNDCDDEADELMALIQALGGRPYQPHLADLFSVAAMRGGRFDEAEGVLKANLSPAELAAGGATIVTTVTAALATRRRIARAVNALDQFFVQLSPSLCTNAFRTNALAWYVQLGALDRAYAFGHTMLDDYISQGTTGIYWGVLWWPAMQPFRKDPRFDDFAGRIGLKEYWRRYGLPDSVIGGN